MSSPDDLKMMSFSLNEVNWWIFFRKFVRKPILVNLCSKHFFFFFFFFFQITIFYMKNDSKIASIFEYKPCL